MNKKVIILYNQLSESPTPDEQDVLDQVSLVKDHLIDLGYEPYDLSMGYNMLPTLEIIKTIKPVFVVNLFESIENKCEFLYFAPALLNSLHIHYTGFPLEALFLTTQKVLTKQQLATIGVPTPQWVTHQNLHQLLPDKTYIIKPLWEEGSLGLDEDCIFQGNNQTFIEKIKRERAANTYFIEEYIVGREFNVAVIGTENGPEVLPLAEILFIDYPNDKYKMVGYKAKWIEDSFEYNNTPRTFELKDISEETKDLIREYCKKCWNHFGGRGYARIDFRLSTNNIPYVLEINGNPCITPGGGFYSAIEKAGYTFNQAMKMIIADAFR
jgi:D-alanine-D-alanine ligase